MGLGAEPISRINKFGTGLGDELTLRVARTSVNVLG